MKGHKPADCIYYLPRPRRFGKSLMISTLKALFQGRRDLFRGLKIERTDWDWENEVYPVLHLDMSQLTSFGYAAFESSLLNFVGGHCRAMGVSFDPSLSAQDNFKNLLEELPLKSPNGKYVLLIDEYDAPIAKFLDSEERRVRGSRRS